MNDYPSLSRDSIFILFWQTRNVDSKKNLGEFPSFVSPILERISMLSKREDVETIALDQLTVSNCAFVNCNLDKAVNRECKYSF